MKTFAFLSILLFVNMSCQHATDQPDRIKNEVINTEKEFATMADKNGIAQAFLYFADQNAVLERNNTLIKGKASIKTYFENQNFSDTKLSWAPDFVEVAASGDLAYSYGRYSITSKDENGKEITKTGVFHTVWKRQPDGSWKYVWD